MQTIATRIRQARERRGMSRRALATEAGVAPYTVRRVEEGKPTQTDTLEALAKALGLRLSLTTQEKT